MEQIKASQKVLKQSQNEEFPYFIQEFGLIIVVHKGVFSPKHFNGWRIFTKNFPSVVGEEVLEIGCGHGATSIYLSKNGAKKVVAVDINKKAIKNTIENIKVNKIKNIDVRLSDVYSGISKKEKFNTIYWNTPFISISKNYKYCSELEKGLFDPGYKLTERFLKEAENYLKENGRILVGTGNFGDIKKLKSLAKRYNYSITLLVREESFEINPIDFQLYELRRRT